MRVNTKGARSDRVHAELAEDLLQLKLDAGLGILTKLHDQPPARFLYEDHHGLHFAGSEDGGKGRSHLLPLIAVEAGQLAAPNLTNRYNNNCFTMLDLFNYLV